MNIDPGRYQLSTVKKQNKTYVWDVVRQKYIKMDPEEWVRQLVIHYLHQERNVPTSLMAVEMNLKVNRLTKRCDLAVYNREGHPKVIIECKAPDVNLTQKTFDQVARYNLALQVKYLVISNGRTNICCLLNYTNNTYQFIDTLPVFEKL